MRKVSFAFPPDLVDSIDAARGNLSRNQFVTRILKDTLRVHREKELARTTAEVYSDPAFAAEEEALLEQFARHAPEIDL